MTGKQWGFQALGSDSEFSVQADMVVVSKVPVPGMIYIPHDHHPVERIKMAKDWKASSSSGMATNFVVYCKFNILC